MHSPPHPPTPSPTQCGCPSFAGGRGAINRGYAPLHGVAEGATVEKKGFIGHTFSRQTKKGCPMNLRKLYQWVKVNSKDWIGVSRHFRANVQVFSREVVLSQSRQVRKMAGMAGG